MKHVHVIFRRINPAIKIDFVQVGYIKDGQFETLHLSELAHTTISDYVKISSISDSPYIEHSCIPKIVKDLVAYPDFSVEFFDNTLVLMFSTNLSPNESSSKEEGKGD